MRIPVRRIDAQTAQVTDSRERPWYVATLLISQPLHFGDYGGMPMQIIWALLDIVTIVVLGSGLYLWLARGGGLRRRLLRPAAAQGSATLDVEREGGAFGAILIQAACKHS